MIRPRRFLEGGKNPRSEESADKDHQVAKTGKVSAQTTQDKTEGSKKDLTNKCRCLRKTAKGREALKRKKGPATLRQQGDWVVCQRYWYTAA